MCYKIAVKSHQQILEDRFDAIFKTESPFTPYFHANGFAHPGLPVITMEHLKEIQIFEWGMIPHLQKRPRMLRN